MNQKEIIKKLYEIGAIKVGSFTLKSGKTSPLYIDMRVIIGFPKLLQAVTNMIWEKVAHLHADLLCGVPYSALPMAACLSIQHDKPMVIVRKEKKDYGTQKQVDGYYQAGQSCLVIEDVVTTGGSIITAVNHLKTAGLQVPYVAAFLDREQGGREALKQAGCEFFCVFTLTQFLKVLEENGICLPQDAGVK